MQFTITETKKKTINLSDDDMRDIAMEYIQKEFKVDPFMWVEGNNLMHEVEYVTSHKWYDNEIVRPITKLDKAALKVIKAMHNKKYGKDDE